MVAVRGCKLTVLKGAGRKTELSQLCSDKGYLLEFLQLLCCLTFISPIIRLIS